MADKSDTLPSLSKEQKQKVIQWLSEKVDPETGLVCSICNTREWTVADDLVIPPVYRGGGFVIGGVGYPQAMLICKNCAHTIYVNAVRIGLWEDEKGESDSPEDPIPQAEEKADG